MTWILTVPIADIIFLDTKILYLYNCGEYQEVQVLDGVFLATSKDIDWREDLFNNWHYYDIAQSFEFQRQGYKVVIPKQRMPWVLHNDKWGEV